MLKVAYISVVAKMSYIETHANINIRKGNVYEEDCKYFVNYGCISRNYISSSCKYKCSD